MTTLDSDLKQQLNETVERFLSERYDFEARQALVASAVGFSPDNWQQFAELGWLGVPFDERYGGFGGELSDTLSIMRLFGRHLVVDPYISTVGLLGSAIAQCDNAALKEDFLPRLIAGEIIGALALEEADSRCNPACVSTRAFAQGDGYRLQGEKVAVFNAPQADYLLVSARLSGDQVDAGGVGLFLVEPGQAGVSMVSYPMVDGHRAANVSLDVLLSPQAMLAGAEEGFTLLRKIVDGGLLMLCAEAVGIMEALLDVTVEYTNTRKQFGVPLSTFQVLRHRMVDMFIEQQRSNALLESVIDSISGGTVSDEHGLHLLKAQVGRSGRVVGDSAIQLHGGMGMTDELIVGHYVKRLVAIDQLLGNADYHLRQAWNCNA